MNDVRILLADDEETFLLATAELIRRRGYACDTAKDATEALDRLNENEYAVLIADIRMPGNVNLDLVRAATSLDPHLQTIIVTAYPAVETAVQAIHLPVSAYLYKPLDIDLLMAHIDAALEVYLLHRSVYESHQQLEEWLQQWHMTALTLAKAQGRTPASDLKTLSALRIQQAVAPLLTLTQSTESSSPLHKEPGSQAERIVLIDALREAVSELYETRSSFKSKRLGDLRKKLEFVLSQYGGDSPGGSPSR